MNFFDKGEKTIIYPVWRNKEKFYVSMREIISQTARWAIHQSPYDFPDNLKEALSKLKEKLEKVFLPDFCTEFYLLSGDEIEKELMICFEEIPEIIKWNEKKDPTKRACMGDSPDGDFIDLHALARNIKHSIQLDREYSK